MWKRFLDVLPRATALGLGLPLVQRLTGLTPSLRISIDSRASFSVVMWAGFHLLHPIFEPRLDRPVEGEALRLMGLITLVYLGLLALSVGLVRLTTGLNLLAHAGIAAITFCIGYAVTLFMVAKASLVDFLHAEHARAKAEARAGLLALQSQLQPHTLFNALNTIAALIPEDPTRAEAATEALSRLLRRIMAAFERERWSLAEEFSVLEDLLALERLRFGSRLRAELDLDPAEAEREVSPLLLLPLVENALKHGFRPKVGPCTLRVVARAGRVRVEDDGVGRDPSAPEGLGLRTVRERHEGARLRWPEVASGCAVELEFPA